MLLQGAFQEDWIKAHPHKQQMQGTKHLPQSTTKASDGHAAGAEHTLKRMATSNIPEIGLFKMPRFKDVPAKIQTERI